jgi:translation initiation factor RLI1
LKEANFYLSSFAAIATAFTSWQTIKKQYSIFRLKEKINNIEKNEVLSVSDFVGRGNKAR